MPTITALEAQKRDVERVNIYLDGEFAFGVGRYVVLERRLIVGRELGHEEVADIRRLEEVERAYSAALNYLSFRPRSRQEIETYLKKRDVDALSIEETISRLEGAKFLDDTAFATFWIENRQTFRPRAARALRAELNQKGVARDIVDETVAALSDDEAAARDAAERKTRSFANLGDREYYQRMVGHLQRRGFTFSTADRIARELLGTRGDAIDVEPFP